MTADIRSFQGGKKSEELPDNECPWCGSQQHRWSACPRVKGFVFFGDYDDWSDVERVEFHSPDDYETILEAIMGATTDEDTEATEPGSEEDD